jgi:nucleoside-diphosphate-sugar epimerase
MISKNKGGVVIVTGAGGHIGREVCRQFRNADKKVLAVDLDPGPAIDVLTCDLRRKDEVEQLFRSQPVDAVIHLAAILPSAFRSNPFWAPT